MEAYETAATTLDRIEKRLTSDRGLSVRAFGLLFFGDTFDKKLEEGKSLDPTDLILREPGLTVPNL